MLSLTLSTDTIISYHITYAPTFAWIPSRGSISEYIFSFVVIHGLVLLQSYMFARHVFVGFHIGRIVVPQHVPLPSSAPPPPPTVGQLPDLFSSGLRSAHKKPTTRNVAA